MRTGNIGKTTVNFWYDWQVENEAASWKGGRVGANTILTMLGAELWGSQTVASGKFVSQGR